jgi:amidase
MLTQLGPMARFVEDLRLLLPIICGPDWRDPAVVPMPLGDPSDVEIQNLRIAVHTDNGVLKPIAAIREAVARRHGHYLPLDSQLKRPALVV